MARDFGGQRSDQLIYLVLGPAGDALLGRNRPCDERVQGWIRLPGEDELLKVLGKGARLPRRDARQPPQHLDPGRGIAVAQFTQCARGQAPGDDVAVRVCARRPGATIEQAELTADRTGAHKRHNAVAVEVWPLHLHAHLPGDDEVARVAWAALAHQTRPHRELDGFQMRLEP